MQINRKKTLQIQVHFISVFRATATSARTRFTGMRRVPLSQGWAVLSGKGPVWAQVFVPTSKCMQVTQVMFQGCYIGGFPVVKNSRPWGCFSFISIANAHHNEKVNSLQYSQSPWKAERKLNRTGHGGVRTPDADSRHCILTDLATCNPETLC